VKPPKKNKPKNRRQQIEQRSREFAQKYPEVGPLFDRFTRELLDRGFRHGGAKAVWERIRWESPVGADGLATWKLGNNFCTHFGRKFMEKYPEHRGFFRTRRLTSEDKPASAGPEIGPDDVDETDK
jgi:hypothetical protein